MKPGRPSTHAAALVDAVKAAAGGVAVYVDMVPASPTYPYVVVWSDSALSDDESLGERRELSTFHPAWTIVSDTAAKVVTVRDRLDALLDEDTVRVPGRLVELVRLSSNSVAQDESIKDRTVYWCRDTFELRSYAA